MGQALFQHRNPAAAMQKRPESGRPGMGAEFLIGKLDLNGLVGALELNLGCHRLVNWACVRGLIGFVHKNNQSTNGGTSPTSPTA